MSKPDGIPEDIWSLAKDLAEGKGIEDGATFSERYAVPIAKALKAERERCAVIAEKYRHHGWHNVEPDKTVFGWGTARTEIARQIRQHH